MCTGVPESSSGNKFPDSQKDCSSPSSTSKTLYCVQLDEYIYNTFALRYSGTKFNIGFPFASGKPTPSSCTTVGKRTFLRRTRGFSRGKSYCCGLVATSQLLQRLLLQEVEPKSSLHLWWRGSTLGSVNSPRNSPASTLRSVK